MKTWSVRWFSQLGSNLYYYDDKHFRSTADAHGFIDLSSVVSVEALPPAQKKDRAKIICVSTNLGRTFLLREPNDDVRKAEEWVSRVDLWRKWIKDGGSSSPPLTTKREEDLARSSSAVANIKPVARGISGAVERSKLMMKKSVRGMGTLVTTTVAKSKGDEGDDEVDGVKKCGWLVKKGQRRWFALHQGELLWFKDAQSSAKTVIKDNAAGCLPLKEGCVVRRVQEKASLVVISPSGKPYELVALDNGTRDVWLNYLTDACGGARARAPTIQLRAPQKLKGWLKRKAGPGKLKPWKRVFVAQQDTDLVFFASDDPSEEPLGQVNLFEITNVDVTYEDGVSPTFEVKTAHVVQYLCALSEEDLEYWVAGLAQFWENKKAHGSSNLGKIPMPKSAPRSVIEAEAATELSPSLIDASMTEDVVELDQNEDARQIKLLAALEDSSNEDLGSTLSMVGTGARQAGGDGENDEEFDSLISALGSEKVKLRDSLQHSNGRVAFQENAGDYDEDDDSMDEMLAVSSQRVKQNKKKTTVIQAAGDESPLMAGDNGMDGRLRSRTEIHRRLQAKEKELEVRAADVDEASPLMKRAETASAKKKKQQRLDEKEEEEERQLLDSVVISSIEESGAAPIVQKKKQPQVTEEDEFDVLGSIPSFDWSDEEPDMLPAAASTSKKDKFEKPPVTAQSDDDEDDDEDDDALPPPPPQLSSSEEEDQPAPQREKKTKVVRRAKQRGPWVVGDRVMAQFEDDELWYKARITNVVEEEIWKVEFIEYGNLQVCEDDMIQVSN